MATVVMLGAYSPSAWVLQCPIPRTYTGLFGRSRARSAEVMITAPAALVFGQQSSRRNGSAIMREAWWSLMVIGVRNAALGLRLACLRQATEMAPNCSLVVPY